MRRNASSQCANSVCSDLRNLRRAGVLKYSSRTSMRVPRGSVAGSGGDSVGPSDATRQAWRSSVVRLVSSRRDTEAMLASASPRKPRLPTCSRSSNEAILLVAWRASANLRSSRVMPLPSSVTETSLTPPATSSTLIAFAPASRLFSSNSFNAEAGRSMTSPAAIWLIRSSGRMRIDDMRRL